MANGTDQLANAFAHHQAGRLQEAEQIYRQILAAEPNNPDALHLLGIIACENGQYEGAIRLLEQALTFRPPGRNRSITWASPAKALEIASARSNATGTAIESCVCRCNEQPRSLRRFAKHVEIALRQTRENSPMKCVDPMWLRRGWKRIGVSFQLPPSHHWHEMSRSLSLDPLPEHCILIDFWKQDPKSSVIPDSTFAV